MERIQSSDLEDNRAVKLAYELAMLGLDNSSALSMESLSLNSHTLAQLEELKTRKSQNMTECVPVPTSEHVAEIVGRQGEYPLLISGVEGIQQKGKVLIFPWY
jgi:RNA-binding protein MEX3